MEASGFGAVVVWAEVAAIKSKHSSILRIASTCKSLKITA